MMLGGRVLQATQPGEEQPARHEAALLWRRREPVQAF